eukprot:5600551-Pleurochrysis_carterae.AAC.3
MEPAQKSGRGRTAVPVSAHIRITEARTAYHHNSPTVSLLHHFSLTASRPVLRPAFPTYPI